MFWLAKVPQVIGSLKPLPVTVSSKISLWPPKLKAPVLHKNEADFFYLLNRLLWVIFNLSLNMSTWNAVSTDRGMLSLVALRRKSYTVSFKVKTSFEVLLFTRPHVPGPGLPFKQEPPTVQACNTFTSKGKLAVKTWQSHKLTFLPVGVLMNNLKFVEVEENRVNGLTDWTVQVDVGWKLTAAFIFQCHRQFDFTLEQVHHVQILKTAHRLQTFTLRFLNSTHTFTLH